MTMISGSESTNCLVDQSVVEVQKSETSVATVATPVFAIFSRSSLARSFSIAIVATVIFFKELPPKTRNGPAAMEMKARCHPFPLRCRPAPHDETFSSRARTSLPEMPSRKNTPNPTICNSPLTLPDRAESRSAGTPDGSHNHVFAHVENLVVRDPLVACRRYPDKSRRISDEIFDALFRRSHHIAGLYVVGFAAAKVCVRTAANLSSVVGGT